MAFICLSGLSKTMSQYKLYGHPVSPYSYLVHAALVCKEIDFEYIYVDLTSGAQKKTEFLDLSPYGQVPLLSNGDDLNIYESWAIFEYLEETYPKINMLHKEQPYRAITRSLCLALMTGIIPSFRELFLHGLGRIQLPVEVQQNIIKSMTEKLTAFQAQRLTLGQPVVFCPIDAVFQQAWQNMCFAWPLASEEFPQLQEYFESLQESPIIQTVESHPAVKQVREYFKGIIAARTA